MKVVFVCKYVILLTIFLLQDNDKNINWQLKKEAEYYGDIIILPFIDIYDIVILKTFEIFKFGVCILTLSKYSQYT